jgi:hypothetical protein
MVMELNNTITIQQLKKKKWHLYMEKKHKKNLHTNNKSHKIQMEKTKKTNYKIIKKQT